ncbi:LANO_0B01354g1_1 [Lachancea nothofagi CBS 11611]|uniref:LANO_0B01354g1_1 n=1 Tax=Lachancea nothofagi CBS 11611 TaxID=1266666 RepID=A0A1G4IUZ2_9SACH|nr:LANO_0B01354g1_1 [Lachancea nothofagi CBS 11611]
MALHNYIYLKHKSHDPQCHTLIARDHDNRPSPLPSKTVNLQVAAVSSEGLNRNNKSECCGKCQGNCEENSSKITNVAW